RGTSSDEKRGYPLCSQYDFTVCDVRFTSRLIKSHIVYIPHGADGFCIILNCAADVFQCAGLSAELYRFITGNRSGAEVRGEKTFILTDVAYRCFFNLPFTCCYGQPENECDSSYFSTRSNVSDSFNGVLSDVQQS